MAQMLNNLPAVWETWVLSLGSEDPLEEGMATPPVFLPGESPWAEVPGGLQHMGSQRNKHNYAAKHSTHNYLRPSDSQLKKQVSGGSC